MIKVEFQEWITRSDLSSNPHKLYVFGDNLARVGLGGQAKEMRGERNSHGIATKRSPYMDDFAFFSDQPDEISQVMSDVSTLLLRTLMNKQIIVWPANGIGTGLARLEEHSPIIYKLIKDFEDYLRRYA